MCAKRFATKRFASGNEASMATIDDVARLAGVGPTTVSHALSGKRHVAPSTRDRILAVVSQLGYHPNATARSLVSHRTMTVGLIVPLDLDVLSDNRSTDFIVGAADRLDNHGYRLLCLIDRNPDVLDVQKLIRSGQVDGTLLLQVRTYDSRVEALKAEGQPFVSIGRPRNASGIVRTDADFEAAAAMAVDYLLGLGHRRIGFLSTGQDNLPVFGFQWYSLRGFRRAHRAHGMPLPKAQILCHGRETEEGLLPALLPVLNGSLPLTALIATTFTEAGLAMQLLSAHGLRTPEDISIIALGEPRSSVLAVPSITVVRFSPTDLTHTAVDLLVDMLEGRSPERLEHLLPVELVVRSSTGPAAHAERAGDAVWETPLRVALSSMAPERGTLSALHERR
jgi:DNA-binding LacI/PurR family transcriptional regulator